MLGQTSLPCLLTGQHPCTPHEWSLGSASNLSVPLVLQAATRACPFWNVQSVAPPAHSPGRVSTRVIRFPSQSPPRVTGAHPALFFPSYLILWNLFIPLVAQELFQFPDGILRDLLHMQMCFWCVCGGRWAPRPHTQPFSSGSDSDLYSNHSNNQLNMCVPMSLPFSPWQTLLSPLNPPSKLQRPWYRRLRQNPF